MADFKGLALQYVLADDDESRQNAVFKTEAAIRTSSVKSTAILGWVQSIDPWMPAALSKNGSSQVADDMGESRDNVVTRAKALDYLADTLSVLDRTILRVDQVNLLVVFFGRLFNVDHKAGIMAASKALRKLATMKGFNPEMGGLILQSVASMRDDFRLQPPQTRLEVYALIQTLTADESVASHLRSTYGLAGGFARDLIQLCGHERDPSCLLQWFQILRDLIGSYEFSPDLYEDLFKAFSAYFPISMRSSVNPAGVTVDDLKLSVRSCFSASDKLAGLAVPFLIQKLDQGDAVTVPVKVDILKTLQSCLEGYQSASQAITPFTGQIWNSLKYEVRNGEVNEIIECTLAVMRTLSCRLAMADVAPSDVASCGPDPIEGLTAMVLDDCLEDLANPAYTKSAGLLLESFMGAHARPFSLMLPRTLDAIVTNLREPRTPGQSRACLAFVTSLLDSRARLFRASVGTEQSSWLENLGELDAILVDRAQAILTQSWRDNSLGDSDADQVTSLKEVARGLAALLRQPAWSGSGETSRLCGDSQCEQICAMLSDRIVNIFSLASSPDTGPRKELADVVVVALRDIVCFYPLGFSSMLDRAVSSIKDRPWGDQPPRKSLHMLKTLLLRLSYIGCSEVPSQGPPLKLMRAFALSMQQLAFSFLDRQLPFELPTLAVSALFSALMLFRDACVSKGLVVKRDLISSAWCQLVADAGVGPSPEPPLASKQHQPDADGTDAPKIFLAYVECAICAVVSFYRRATTIVTEQPAPEPRLSPDFGVDAISSGAAARTKDLQDVYLHQLADMATFVIRDLEECEQQSLGIAAEAFGLFSLSHPPTAWLSAHDGGRTNVLSLGILRGLRPGPLTQMVASAIFAETILSDVTTAEGLPERTQKVRDQVLAVIANKWVVKPGPQVLESQAWEATVASLESFVRHSTTGMRLEAFSRILALLAGAIARRDKAVNNLATLVSALPASAGPDADCMARCLEDLISSKIQLGTENHAIVKPLYQQWVYVRFASPRTRTAFPIVQNKAKGIVHAIAVVRILRHMDFHVYEGDIGDVVRIVIAGTSSFGNYGDVEASLAVLRHVLEHSPDALKDQIKAVVSGGIKVLKCGLGHLPGPPRGSKVSSRFLRQGSPASCRNLALLLLKELAQHFDERLLGQYSANMFRVLGDACGDPVREVRQSALAARRSWASIAQR